MVQVVVLSANGESRTLKTTAITASAPITGEAVGKALRKTRAAEHIGTYTWDGRELQLWGWREGKAGTENQHDLPEPYADVTLFGDVVVTGAGTDFTAEQWAVAAAAVAAPAPADLGTDADAEDADEELDDADAVVEEEDAEIEEECEEEEDDAVSEEDDVEEDDADDDCYEDGDDGGGGKRRAPRRRMASAPEYRRMEMGLRARVKIPTPVGKRAPRWQTAAELETESYAL